MDWFQKLEIVVPFLLILFKNDVVLFYLTFLGVAINKKVTLDNHINIFLEKSVKISVRF